MIRKTMVAAAVVAASLTWGLVAVGQSPSEPGAAPPRLSGSRVDQVTVDVVVLDKKGNPVTGLTKEDFSVREEGQAKEIANFEFIDRRTEAGPGEAAKTARPRVATNVAPVRDTADRGRDFVILFDDLNLSMVNAHNAKTAVAAFLDQGVVEGDTVTLIATSGATWWSTRMKGGREDLIAILKRLDGRRIPETATERITDYEAVQIAYFHDTSVATRVQSRLERYGTALIQSPDKGAEAVAKEQYQRGVVDPFVEMKAQETYLKMRTRVNTTLQAIERAIRSLSNGRDRKALVLVSEGFVHDPSQGRLRNVVEAARRTNAAIYFIDACGLRALDPMYSAEFGPALDSRDTMTAIADLSREGEGAEILSSDTGGFSVRASNDFSRAARIGEESQAFYLLGYDPGEVLRDGRFRKIEVKLRGGRYTVRARRGYYAPEPEGAEPQDEEKEGGPDLALQAALDASLVGAAIPLRMTAYALEDEALGKVRVVVAADADISQVEFKDVEGQPRATLDTILVVAHRDSGDAERVDQQVEIQLKPGVTPRSPAWYSFLREVVVPAGQFQAKLVVRDTTSKRVGTVVHQFGISPRDTLRVSTPVLTDVLTESSAGPVPAFLARRTFASGGQLYCRFDVYRAGRNPKGLPSVQAGYAIRRADGSVTRRADATLIEPTSLGALARMIQIPLTGLSAGDYELVLTVTDQVTKVTQEIVEPFTVTMPMAASR